jgi:hypothetical protein
MSLIVRKTRGVLSSIESEPLPALIEALGDLLSLDGRLSIRVDTKDLSGIAFEVVRRSGGLTIDASIDARAQLSNLHALNAMLYPNLFSEMEKVETLFWPKAFFDYVDPHLKGPMLQNCASLSESLLQFLGRVRTTDGIQDGLGMRFVEPGIGRTVLVPLLRVEGHPELIDFSALGIGLTPYAEGNFVLKGNEIDGYCSLIKTRHRKRIAEYLREIGCRVPHTCCIIALPGISKVWPDGRTTEAAILVRGAKMNLRVQQLDPLHGFFHNQKLFAPMMEILRTSNEFLTIELKDGVNGEEILQEACKHLDIRAIACRDRYENRKSTLALLLGRRLRLRYLKDFAPLAIKLAKQRLASELGLDRDIADLEYARWFAETLGTQLALMRDARFLFDYRPGREPRIANALHESQISLLCEFHDLDTGIFLDSDETDGVLLTNDQLSELRANFETHHKAELKEASGIVKTLSLIACHENEEDVLATLAAFQDAYEATTIRSTQPRVANSMELIESRHENQC